MFLEAVRFILKPLLLRTKLPIISHASLSIAITVVACTPTTKRQLISHATMMLLGCGATCLAAKCLLSAGRIDDAMAVCSKALAKRSRVHKGVEEATCGEGTQAKDFLRAAGESNGIENLLGRYGFLVVASIAF